MNLFEWPASVVAKLHARLVDSSGQDPSWPQDGREWRYSLIEKLDLQPADIIVVTVHSLTTATAIGRLKVQLAADFPDHQVVVLPRHSRLSVLRPSKEEPQR